METKSESPAIEAKPEPALSKGLSYDIQLDDLLSKNDPRPSLIRKLTYDVGVDDLLKLPEVNDKPRMSDLMLTDFNPQ